MSRSPALVALALATLMSGTAHAATLFEADELKLSVGSLARLGYLAEFQGDEASQRPFFQFARLSAGVEDTRFGRAFVQVEGASESLRLLDAFVELRADKALAARIGVFRLPTTADFHVGAANILFSNRSLLVSMIQPRLAGAEIESTIGTDDVSFNARLGWFQPTTDTRVLLPGGDGNFASVRLGVDFAVGLGLHFAYLQLLLADNDLVTIDDPEPVEVRPVDFPQVFDAAITFRRGAWDTSIEGLIAPDEGGGAAHLAGYAQAGYRFDLSDAIWLMPAGRIGFLNIDEVTTSRVTVGAALGLGDHFKVLPNYELRLQEGGSESHLILLTLQGGF